MAKRPKETTADIDWYLISIDRLKQIGLAVLVVLVATGGYLYYNFDRKNPQRRAENAISDAQKALNDLAASKDFNSFRSEFDRGNAKLAEARTLYSGNKYPEAETAAVESQTITRAALARQPGGQEQDAQFVTVEGNVQFQKSAGGDFRRADPGTLLYNGDWVKTGEGSSAELIFSNGSLYTVGPDALLEIYSTINPATSKKQNAVQMKVGSVAINTADDESTVKTPGSQVTVGSESAAQVGVDARQQTKIVALKGNSSIMPSSGGGAIQLSSGQEVEATDAGRLSAVSLYITPPALVSPSDNQVFQATPNFTVQMAWATVPDAAGYQLQVSRSRLFSNLEIDARRSTTNATAKVTSEGTFYWRVASVSPKGDVGPFSSFRRFRVTGLGASTSSSEADTTPPTLELKRPFKIGGQYYMIEGKVEPGASLFINDEECKDVSSDGSFQKLISFDKVGWNTVVVKAVDAAGNATIQSEKVRVED
ncbi:MAG: FecR domain-containing protein [Thermoanaerobaculia bacterium]